MMTIRKVFFRYLGDESGATAIEYGLIAALIAVGIIGGARAFTQSSNDMFTDVDNGLVQTLDSTSKNKIIK